MNIERLPNSDRLSTMANFSPVISFDSQCGPKMRYEKYIRMNNCHILLYEASFFTLLWSLERIHDTQKDQGGEEGVFDILGRTEGDEHQGCETERFIFKKCHETIGYLKCIS